VAAERKISIMKRTLSMWVWALALQAGCGAVVAQNDDLNNYLESILGTTPIRVEAAPAPPVATPAVPQDDTATIVRNRIRLSEPYIGADGLRQMEADIARCFAPRITFLASGGSVKNATVLTHATMAKSLRSFNANWPNRRYDVLAVARSGNTIEIQVRYERVDKKGVSSTGYALFKVVVDSQGKMTTLGESSSLYSPPSFSPGMQQVPYNNSGSSAAAYTPAVGSRMDRSSLDPLIARIRALKCKYAVSAEQQRHLLELLPRIRQGESVNLVLPSTNGCTALHYSCGIGSLSITKWLLEHGANPNARDNNGMVPLHCVGNDNRDAIIQALRDHGAQW
jgi:hypothetical protein